MTDYKFPYWGPFLFESKIDDSLVKLLLKKGKKASQNKSNDARKTLAGEIDNEYTFETPFDWFYSEFNPYVDAYIEAVSNYKIDPFPSPPVDWNLRSLWINFQKAYEYNPPHHHSGDLSFVIYLQVPEEIVQENKKRQGEHNNPGPGMINFDFVHDMSFSISRRSMMPEVGEVFIFPAWLPHHVNSFKSDVERISVSGNITFIYD